MSFAFLEPTSVTEALEMLSRSGPDARLLAGGTDLGVLLRRHKAAPSHLVSVANIPELGRLAAEGSETVIGARVPHRAVEASPLFAGPLLALPEACATVGSVQIRNVGTIGGNLCNASPAADTPPVLLAFGAAVTIAGREGRRLVTLEQFFQGYRKTAVGADELLLDVRIPVPSPRTGSAFEKIGRRKAMEISIACVAALVTLAPDRLTCAEVRIGLGSVAAVSMRAAKAETVLRGRIPTADLVAEAARIAAEECAPIDDLRATAEYRRLVVETLVARAVRRAAARALADPR